MVKTEMERMVHLARKETLGGMAGMGEMEEKGDQVNPAP